MNYPALAMQTPIREATSDTRLQGRRLVIARIVWVILVLINLVLLGSMLPAYLTQLQTVCTALPCARNQLSLDTVQMLREYNLSVLHYSISAFIFTLPMILISFVVALLIIWHKSDDWVALFVAFFLMTLGPLYISAMLTLGSSVWRWPATIVSTLTFGLIPLFYSIFPSGRFVPRWTPWLIIVWIGWRIVFTILSVINVPFPIWLDNVIWVSISALCTFIQAYRYKYVSNSAQCQQTKWVVYGASLTAIIVTTLEVPNIVMSSLGASPLYSLLSWYVLILAVIPIPVTVGIAMLRSRLWDIDALINRTLVYSTLTGTLAAIYVGLIIGLQGLMSAITSQNSQSPPVIMASTLTVAFLFQPLRKNIQTLIDRRFYRRKYLAEQTLQAFSSTLRNEVDLNHLQEELLQIVHETIQPTHVSLWLCEVESQVSPALYDSLAHLREMHPLVSQEDA